MSPILRTGRLILLALLLSVLVSQPALAKNGTQTEGQPAKSAQSAKSARATKSTRPARTAQQEAPILAPEKVREGDVIFQITTSPQSKAIQMATGSRYTHCGIVLKKDGELQVFEAIRTVGWAPLQEWIKRGVNRHYVLMRLRDTAPLTPAALAAMRKDTQTFNGLGYDIFFQWDDAEIYCSELVWKLYKRNANLELGPLRTFRDYNLNHGEVQRIARERFGKDIPLDSQVTAPSDIMDSDLLEVVAKN
ncbi:hypothetical protein LJC48_06760 [Desulfovibrio sp. OttesenSCG-928-C06]|nr:hypothetical protein [Desulfovibrio sp. OttesenSCG-928-C06]